MVKNKRPETVLAIRFSAIGDVAMALAATYRAAIANPGVQFIFVTRKNTAQIAVNPPDNLTVLGISTDSYKGVGGMFRLFSELQRKYRFDAVADLHSVIRSRLISLAARLRGIKVASLHKGRAERRALTRADGKVMKPLREMGMRYADVFATLNLSSAESFHGIFSTIPPDTSSFSAATAPKSDDERWIGIAPFAKHPGKIYPLELMENVVAKIAALPNVKIFLFGAGEEEEKVLAGWVSKYHHCVNMAELRLGFASELALFGCCDVVLSMDSANMHLASLAAVPVVSIWGATHPYAGFSGIGQSAANAIGVDLPCRPCSVFGNKPCIHGDLRCMQMISPETVIDRLLPYLQK